jgi:hypothetical protein
LSAVAANLVSWRTAWDTALYADDGFFRTSRPADHFRTSAHVAPWAAAVAELARSIEATTVVDVGAGGGELLRALHRLLPGVLLIGVEVAGRPDGLPTDIGWQSHVPDHVDGLLVANEWLDNVPCTVVELDRDGTVREVLVDPATGSESLGEAYDESTPEGRWLDAWWPLIEPGQRAEVGLDRDTAWADAVSRVHGTAVAIDYGHLRDDRPMFGSLRSYARGQEVDVRPDGSRDVTAHVAVDAVAAAAGGRLARQRDALADLGVDGARPPLDLARTDPAAYVRALSRAGESAELVRRGGLGDFWWIVTDTRDQP